MNIKDIRRNNLTYLTDKHGRPFIAKKLGYDNTNYIHQLVTGNGSFGDKVARKIEEALELPTYWMDKAHKENYSDIDLECEKVFSELDEDKQKMAINIMKAMPADN